MVTAGGVQTIEIKPTNSQAKITLGNGPNGLDALPSLGLTSGVVTTITTIPSTTSTLKSSYGLGLSSTLNLGSAANIAQAQAALKSAMGAIATIYLNQTTPPAPKAGANTSAQGKAPAYILAQLANYQAGLARLTGSSATGGSSGSSLASLFTA